MEVEKIRVCVKVDKTDGVPFIEFPCRRFSKQGVFCKVRLWKEGDTFKSWVWTLTQKKASEQIARQVCDEYNESHKDTILTPLNSNEFWEEKEMVCLYG